MADTAEREQGQKSESLLTVIIALAMNALIALAKSIVAVITGSASMVAEAAHSWADAGNEIFLLIAERRAAQPRDASHPFGYGREAYVWSMFAAFGLFGAGAVVSVWHGITALGHEEPETSYFWAYAVLAIAFVLESVSFVQATRQTRSEARRLGLRPLKFIANTSNPTLRPSSPRTPPPRRSAHRRPRDLPAPDHRATRSRRDRLDPRRPAARRRRDLPHRRNRDFLVGQAVRPELWRRAYDDLHDSGEVERVTFLHLEFVGPGRVFLVAAVDLTGDDTEARVADRLTELGRRLERNELVERAMITLSRSDARELDLGEGPQSHGGRVSADPPDRGSARRHPAIGAVGLTRSGHVPHSARKRINSAHFRSFVCQGDEVRYARHRAIADEVRDGAVSVQDLVARLGVSPATIRRDLAELSDAGLVRRVHGGARPSVAVEIDRPYEEAADDAAAGSAPSRASAADSSQDGDTVLLDIGTTTGALARELRGRRVTVITPSLAVLDELRGDPVVDVVVLGGFLRRAYLSLVGPLTEEALRRVRASTVFLGTSGIDADGWVLDTTSVEVPTKRRLLEAGGRIVLLADHTKFPGQGSIRVCDFAPCPSSSPPHAADPHRSTSRGPMAPRSSSSDDPCPPHATRPSPP